MQLYSKFGFKLTFISRFHIVISFMLVVSTLLFSGKLSFSIFSLGMSSVMNSLSFWDNLYFLLMSEQKLCQKKHPVGWQVFVVVSALWIYQIHYLKWISAEKSTDSLMKILLFVTCYFSVVTFRILFYLWLLQLGYNVFQYKNLFKLNLFQAFDLHRYEH